MIWIFVIFGLFFFAAFFGVAYLIYKVVKKSLTPKSAEFIADEKQTMKAKVQSMKPSLSAWGNHTYQDITSAMTFKAVRATTNKLTGKIYSPKREPLIAFDRMERGLAANGYMFASSSDFDLYYDINIRHFRIKFNDEYLGEVLTSGDILDKDKNKIGHANHPVKVSGNIGPIDIRKGDRQFPLEMNGRKLATINVAPNYSNMNVSSIGLVFNENNWGQPILELHDTPNEEEEKWLLALSILETAFHGHWLI